MAPSILSADFSQLGAQLDEVMAAGARLIHVDVMDGHFVPPITIGPLVVGSIADQVHQAGGALDVHLMIERPADQVAEFARAGADCISFHFEADAHAHRTLGAIREAGCLAGLALNPGTPAESAIELTDSADLILCMSVNPGWGGQPFMASSPDKVSRLRALRRPGDRGGWRLGRRDGGRRRPGGREPVRRRIRGLPRPGAGGGVSAYCGSTRAS